MDEMISDAHLDNDQVMTWLCKNKNIKLKGDCGGATCESSNGCWGREASVPFSQERILEMQINTLGVGGTDKYQFIWNYRFPWMPDS